MAIKTSIIFIAVDKVTANARKITRSILGVDRATRKAGITADKTALKFSKMANTGIAKFKGLALAGAAFFGAKKFLTTGAAFQDQIQELSAITGAAGKDLAFLSEEALRLSKVSVVSGAKVAEAFKLIASAKDDLLQDPKGLSKVTEQVLLLSNASGVDLAVAAATVGQALNQFGAGADQAARFVNVMAAGAKFGASEVEDTGEALLKAGVIASISGLSFEQTNAALQTLALTGLKGVIAGTGLAGVLLRLRNRGIDVQKIGLEKTFTMINEALNKTTDSTKRAKLEQFLFGIEHAKTGLSLAKNSLKLGEYTRKLTGTNTAQEQANVNLNKFSSRAKSLGIVIDTILIKTFNKIEPLMSKLVVGVGAFFEKFDSSDIEATALALSGLLRILQLIGIALGFIADIVATVFKPIISIIKGFGTFFGEQIAAIATGDILIREDGSVGLKEAFSLGGKLFGLFGEGNDTADKVATSADLNTLINNTLNAANAPAQNITGGEKQQSNVVDINLNIGGNTGIVDSVTTKSKGRTALPVKTNMASF